jgi:hypothetical protein
MEFRMDGKKGKTVKPYGSGFIDTSVARDGLSDTLNRVSYGKERIVIRRHGRPVPPWPRPGRMIRSPGKR